VRPAIVGWLAFAAVGITGYIDDWSEFGWGALAVFPLGAYALGAGLAAVLARAPMSAARWSALLALAVAASFLARWWSAWPLHSMLPMSREVYQAEIRHWAAMPLAATIGVAVFVGLLHIVAAWTRTTTR
jgi:hypothetical protein